LAVISVDVITLASDQHTISVYLWNHGEWMTYSGQAAGCSPSTDEFSFRRSASFRHPQRIYNVVPGDYTHDGKLDLLVMAQGASTTQLSLSVYTSMPGGGFCRLFLPLPYSFAQQTADTTPLELPPSTLSQPIPFDSDGQMRIDLLGVQAGIPQLSMWKNVWNASDPSGTLYEM
jgi:integrin alpha FG-GAP repeat containing protein 1